MNTRTDIQTLKDRKKELHLTDEQLSFMSGITPDRIRDFFNDSTDAAETAAIMNILDTALEDGFRYCTRSGSGTLSDSGTISSIDRLCESVPLYHTDKNGTYTLKDYDALPEDVRAELIDGYLITMDAPTIRHQNIIGELFYYILHYIKTNKGTCRVLPSPLAVRLDNDDKTILEPDLVIICDPKKSDGKRINGAPDFIAEIVSPSSRQRDYMIKFNKYLHAGVREYWIIDPELKQVLVYRFDAPDQPFDKKLYTFHDRIPLSIYEDLIIDFNELDIYSL